MKQWIPSDKVKNLVLRGDPIKGFSVLELWDKSTFYNGGKNHGMGGITYKRNRVTFSDILIRSDNAARQASIIYHELVHVAQQLDWGWWRFMFKYLDQWRRAGFNYSNMRRSSIEGEAYKLQERFNRKVLNYEYL